MALTPKFALVSIAVFALSMLIVGRERWWLCAIAFIGFRITQLDFFQKIRKTIKRDLIGLHLLIRVKREIVKRIKSNKPIHSIFLEQVRKHPNKLACIEIDTERKLTYAELNKLMNKYANFFQNEGLKSGDVVSLYLENSIDFFAIWLGLSKIGVVSSFINSNLKLEPLAHSITVAKSQKIITSTSLLPTLSATLAAGLIPDNQEILLVSGEHETHRILEKLLRNSSEEEPDSSDVNFQNVLCYIYTSGTTGNPKPAIIKHFRYYWIAMGSGSAFGVREDDVVYITMPLYHSAAGIMGIGSMIVKGTTTVIRKKFSASNFWKDCVKYNCTASQYIGEICRYLLAQPESSLEKQHRVRLMWGNGLRAEIWPEFVARFGIRRIGELYGSTEGNSNIVNVDNHVGSCGFFPIYPGLTALYPVRLIKIDEETGELVRDEKTGLCVQCKPGEIGEMVGVIKKEDILLKFEGYVDEKDTQKKIYRDVVKKGDYVFASGDILFWDELGYLYFKDRRGDTYRWKGENVSTTEVEGILQPVKSVEDATVYGVEIPKMEGRAGMAAIVLNDGENETAFLEEIAARLCDNLASYAIPCFVRMCKEVDRTGTFKLKKTDLQKQGFDLLKCNGDHVYYWDASLKRYRELDEKKQKDIETGVYNKF
ncbi:unnamed protein product [Auanema sp. JU1783]|nr:unnamed protein product [Auanema sp. JU1783]